MEYGLIGEKLGHSFSAIIHPMIADYRYELCEVAKEDLDAFMKKHEFKAINVTVPYKEQVIPYLYEISPEAKRIGAVNTIVNRDGKLYGYNTDYFGIVSLAEHMGLTVKGKKVLILGTGGTSKTAYAVMTDLGASEIYKISRSGKDGALTYEEAAEKHGDADIIVNTTPSGMFPKTFDKPIDISLFPSLSGVIDVVYNPLRTNLVIDAGKRGIKAEGGLYMLVAQAVAAAGIFTGKEFPPDVTDRVFCLLAKDKRNAVLIGMPTCGKTSVGKALAAKTGRKLFDSDEEFTKTLGVTPAEYIRKFGESEFRKKESEVIASLGGESGCIISLGGGSVLNFENVREMKKNGIVFWLDRSPSLLKVSPDRPLSDTPEKLMALYEKRAPIYKAAADIVIKSDKDEDERASLVLEKL